MPRPERDVPRKYGDRKERELHDQGYRPTPGSGSSSVKGDLRRADFMVEVKATRNHSYSVTAETMGKVRNDTLTNGRKGVLIVRLGDGTELAIMETTTFERLVPSD